MCRWRLLILHNHTLHYSKKIPSDEIQQYFSRISTTQILKVNYLIAKHNREVGLQFENNRGYSHCIDPLINSRGP